MQQEIQQHLDNKVIDNFYGRFKAELQAALETTTPSGLMEKLKATFSNHRSQPAFSQATAELGLLLINSIKSVRDQHYQLTHNVPVERRNARYNRIKELLGTEEWNNQEHYQLLEYFLGTEKAAYARLAWQNIRYQMYQTGYARRSFRAPHNSDLYFVNQVNFIIGIIPQAYHHGHDASYNTVLTYYDLSVPDQIRYNVYYGEHNQELFRLWSAALDMDNKAVFQQMEDIIFNKDETGKMTRSILKALLNSYKPEAWTLVEKLLLAAQRQEGLRQTIIEALDETSIGALKHIMRVVVEHQLYRFSSVVRAIDVWAGLGWESERDTTVRTFLEKALLYLDNEALIPEGIRSKNNADVYMALWAQGVTDIDLTIPYLQELQRSPDAEKRTLVLMFANQAVYYQLQVPLYYEGLHDQSIEPLAWAISYMDHIVGYSQNNMYVDAQYPDLFDLLRTIYDRITIKEKTIESYVFSWNKIKFEKRTFLQTMLKLVLSRQDRLDVMLKYLEGMDADLKRQLSRIILPHHAAYDFKAGITFAKPITPFQRQYAMLMLKDRSEFEVAYKALYNTSFEPAELAIVPELLKRKAAGFRNNLITLLLQQKDEAIAPILTQLTLEGDVEQRLAGLDILIQLKKTNRLPQDCQRCIVAFRERKTISAKEDILLSQLTDESSITDISADNGYGLYDPQQIAPVIVPQGNPAGLYEQLIAQHPYGFSRPLKDILKALEDLGNVYEQHQDHEYEVQYYDNSREKTLLANRFSKKKVNGEFASKTEEYQNYPLPDVWDSWYQQSGLMPVDLVIIDLASHITHLGTDPVLKPYLPAHTELSPGKFKDKRHNNNPIYDICSALQLIHPYDQFNDFFLGINTHLFASLGDDILKNKKEDKYAYYNKTHGGWQEDSMLSFTQLPPDIQPHQ